jgi:hypothetical protein
MPAPAVAPAAPTAAPAATAAAKPDSRQTLTKHDDEFIKMYNDGIEAYNGGRFQEAINLFTRAIGLKPGYALAYRSRSMARLDMGDKAGALADAQEAVRLTPNNPLVRFARGIINFQLRNDPEAVEDFYEVLRQNPNDREARENFATLTLGSCKSMFPAQGVAPAVGHGAPAAPSAEDNWPPDAPVLPEIPGPGRPGQPVGGMFANVLRNVIIDKATGSLALLGDYDPRYPTGPLPYWEFLQAVWNRPKNDPQVTDPNISLEPGDDWQATRDAVSQELGDAIFQKAAQQLDDPAVAKFFGVNFGWSREEARNRIARLAGRSGNPARLAEMKQFFLASRPMLRSEGLWVPPEYLSRFTGLVPHVALVFGNVDPRTQLARALFASDYCLKHSETWKPLESYVPGYLTFAHFCRLHGVRPRPGGPPEAIRATVAPGRIVLWQADQGNRIILGFPETRLRLEIASHAGAESNVPPAMLSEYARLWEGHQEALARWCPAFHEFREAAKILALSKYLEENDIHLEFPAEIWNPWEGPASVPGFVSVTVYDRDDAQRGNYFHATMEGGAIGNTDQKVLEPFPPGATLRDLGHLSTVPRVKPDGSTALPANPLFPKGPAATPSVAPAVPRIDAGGKKMLVPFQIGATLRDLGHFGTTPRVGPDGKSALPSNPLFRYLEEELASHPPAQPAAPSQQPVASQEPAVIPAQGPPAAPPQPTMPTTGSVLQFSGLRTVAAIRELTGQRAPVELGGQSPNMPGHPVQNPSPQTPGQPASAPQPIDVPDLRGARSDVVEPLRVLGRTGPGGHVMLVPGNADMSLHTPTEILGMCARAGIPPADAQRLSAAGYRTVTDALGRTSRVYVEGEAARRLAESLKDIRIPGNAARQIAYEHVVGCLAEARRAYEAARRQNPDARPWNRLPPEFVAFILDMALTNDYTAATRSYIQRDLEMNDLAGLLTSMQDVNYWVNRHGTAPQLFAQRVIWLRQQLGRDPYAPIRGWTWSADHTTGYPMAPGDQ